MSKSKKPTKAQIEVLKKLNEGLFLMRNDWLCVSWAVVDFDTKKKTIVNANVAKALAYSEFCEQDKSKLDDKFEKYFFITHKGEEAVKQSTSGES